MNFSEKLISIRRAKGISQEQLANLIDVSRQAVSKWETAESQPDLAKLILMSNAFDVTLDELCGRKTESAPGLPTAAPKPPIRIVWFCAASLIVGLAIGLAGGFSAAGVFSPKATAQPVMSAANTSSVLSQKASPQPIEKITITSFSIYPELYNQKFKLAFSPSIARDTFQYKVVKTNSEGKVSSYPAIYAQGACTCDVSVQDFEAFTLNAVISDGANEYTAGLIRIKDLSLSEGSYGYEELWNK